MRLQTAAFVVSAVLMSGCGDRANRASPGVTPDTGGTAVVGLRTDLDAANFFVSGNPVTHEVLRYLLFLPLLQYDSALGYQPVLAQSYELQGDTSVLFRLRRDVYWHDGVHTTAHDVAFTFVRGADPETGFPNADWLVGWGVPQVIDSFTIRFPLVRMVDPLASVAMFPIMPRHLLEPIRPADLQNAEFNKKPVGNGPFRFVEYRANDRWVFEANRSFSPSLGGRPYLNRLVLRIIPDHTALVAELRAGNVDVAFNAPVEQYSQLDADPQLRGILRPTRNYGMIPWNGRRAPLNDARVRRALGLAIDRREIIDVLRGGRATPIDGPIGRYHWAFDHELPALPYSPDSARTLLAASGLRDRNNDRFLERPNGRPWQIELKYPANQQVSRDVAEMIRADLEQVGVRVLARPVDGPTLFDDVMGSRRNFDAAILGWESDFRINVRDMFHSAALGGPYQFASYRNPTVDSLIDAASRETDRTRAKPLWSRFQRIMRDEQPLGFLWEYPELYVVRERLQGVQMDIRGTLVNAPKWWVRREAAANDSASAQR